MHFLLGKCSNWFDILVVLIEGTVGVFLNGRSVGDVMEGEFFGLLSCLWSCDRFLNSEMEFISLQC